MRNSALVLSLAASVLAHSHVDEIWAPNPSVHYQGWNPNEFDTVPYPNDTPGWVSPSPNITLQIAHANVRNSTPRTVAATHCIPVTQTSTRSFVPKTLRRPISAPRLHRARRCASAGGIRDSGLLRTRDLLLITLRLAMGRAAALIPQR